MSDVSNIALIIFLPQDDAGKEEDAKIKPVFRVIYSKDITVLIN
jgi:hypothetical protein